MGSYRLNDDPEATDFTLPERSGVSTAHDFAAAGRALAPGARLRVEAGAVARMSCATIVGAMPEFG